MMFGKHRLLKTKNCFYSSPNKSNRKAMNRNWSNQKANPALKSLMDLAYQKIDSFIDNSNKCLIYKHLPKQRLLQQYLVKNMSPKCRKMITKFRVSAHKLSIETGRYDAVIRSNRKCAKCNLDEIEDEFHFILKCPYYDAIRKQNIKPYFYKRPSVFK